MEAEYENFVRVLRDRSNVPMDNVQLAQFVSALLTALPNFLNQPQPTVVAMTENNEMVLEIRLGRQGRQALVAQIIAVVLDPPAEAQPVPSGLKIR